MSVQRGAPIEGFAAHLADMWPVGGVNYLVSAQGAGLAETLSANLEMTKIFKVDTLMVKRLK